MSFKRKFAYFFLCLCFGSLILGIGFYFRLYPLSRHASLNAQNRATLLVLSKLRNATSRYIQKHFPQVNDFEKRDLAQKGFEGIIRKESPNVRSSIEKVAREIDKNEGFSSPPFLLEADSYNFYGLTKKIAETGSLSDRVKGSKYFNSRMLAPFGHYEPFTLHPYAGFLIYTVLNIVFPGIAIMYAVSFTPLVITALSFLAFLVLCRQLGCGNLPALTAALLFLLCPIFIKRSAFGWYDNDPYNIFFPLLILNFLFAGLMARQQLFRSLLYASLASFTISFYALFWQGWVYFLGVIVASGILILIYSLVRSRREVVGLLLFFCVVTAGSFAWINYFFGSNEFFTLFKEGYQALNNFLTPQFRIWPDVFLGVGELHKIPVLSVIMEIGGLPFAILALYGFILLTFKLMRRTVDFPVYISLSVFLLISVFLALRVQRFALLSVVPISLFAAIGINGICKLPLKFIELKGLKNPLYQFSLRAISAIFFIVLFIFSGRQAHETMLAWRPIYNEVWDSVMAAIRTQTPKDSIINSWWPPGHFITSMGERRVLFDGATINNPQAYWIANVFLSPDEKIAAGILRTLNNSANQSVDYLMNHGLSISQAVDLIKEISTMDKERAEKTLGQKTKLNIFEAAELLKLTHAPPPPSYIFIYNDLVEKNLELSFIGKWDFKKVEKLQSDPEALRRIPARQSKEYIQFLWDLADGPLNYSEILGQVNRKDNTIIFSDGIGIDLSTMTCEVFSEKFGKGIPKSIFYAKENKIIEKVLPGSTLPFSILLLQEKNLYSVMVLDGRLAGSLLFKLYFFDGKGLKYFEPFVKESDLTGQTKISVFRVNWDKFLEDISWLNN